MTLPCENNVCFTGPESHGSASNGIDETSSVSIDIDRQIESIRASVDLQVLSTANDPT